MLEIPSGERSSNYLRQIRNSFAYRILGMIASFISIRLLIQYLGEEQFGIWSTLLTVMSWAFLFDFGVGNGMRNKVTELLAKGNDLEAGNYVSSGYTLIGLIALVIWLTVLAGSYMVPWQIVFNTNSISANILGETVRVSSFFILFNFWIGLINSLLGATQRTSLVALGQLISSLFGLILIYFLARTSEPLIVDIAFVYGISLTIGNMVLNFWFFKNQPALSPRINLNKCHITPLLTVGLQFFVIQLAVLVIFTTDKIVITQIFGSQHVTHYDVVFKLFGILTFVHGIISAPLWSAYADAYHRCDIDWIKSTLQQQLIFFIVAVFSVLFLIALTPLAIGIWIGHNFFIPDYLATSMGIFVILSIWNNIFATLLNGIGEIKLQLYLAVVAMMINIPLSIFFAISTYLNVSAVVVASICSLLLPAIGLPIEVNRHIKKLVVNKNNMNS